MMKPSMATETIVEEVTIRASAERVFQALTSPEERVKWFYSDGKFEVTGLESDLRPGGRWTMRGLRRGGQPFTITGVYRAIERPRVLEFTWFPDWQENAEETVVRWDLEEKSGVTTLRLTHSGFTTEASRATHRGWPLILSGLQTYVEKAG